MTFWWKQKIVPLKTNELPRCKQTGYLKPTAHAEYAPRGVELYPNEIKYKKNEKRKMDNG